MIDIRYLDFKASLDDLTHTAASGYEIDMDEVQKRLNKVVIAELKAMGFKLPKGTSSKDSPIYEVNMSVRL